MNKEELFVIELDFHTMTHPSDKDAFRIFIDRFTVNASSETFAMLHSVSDLQEIESLIKQKLEQSS